MHVTESKSRKPKAKLNSKKSCKASITKSIVEERLIQCGMKEQSGFFKKHNLGTTVGEQRL